MHNTHIQHNTVRNIKEGTAAKTGILACHAISSELRQHLLTLSLAHQASLKMQLRMLMPASDCCQASSLI